MIVITGAAGRLGSKIARLLLDRGYDVLGTDKLPSTDSALKFVQGDLLDRGLVASLLDGAAAVIHMGAIPGPEVAEPREIFDNNVESTMNVMMTAADRVFVKRLRYGMGARRGGLRSAVSTPR